MDEVSAPRSFTGRSKPMYSAFLLLALHSVADVPSQVLYPFEGFGRNECGTPSWPVAPPLVHCFRLGDKPAARQDVVLRWNSVLLDAIRADETPPPLAARNLAIVHAAIYDAVNAVFQTHQPYYVNAAATAGESPEAAAAVAAHCTLVSLYPRQVQRFDAALDASLENIPEGQAKTGGIHLGQYVAEKMLDWRSRDGASARVAYNPLPGPGVWQPTPTQLLPPLLPQWPGVTCFCMRSGSQFRTAGPPELGGAIYWANYREVKSLGGVNSSTRTAEQTEIAWFWKACERTPTPPGQWNQITQIVARQRGTTLAENARLFALLNLAMADAGIMSWDCKYKFNYWRPVQAIRSTRVTDDPATGGDPRWLPLIETPPFPAYTSGHSSFSGTASRVLANFFGTDHVSFTLTSDSLPGVRRSFKSFSQAADEAGMSRIYGGIHWQFDNTDGLASGRTLADYVTRNFLTPRVVAAVAKPVQ
jgi:hypothetical protein